MADNSLFSVLPKLIFIMSDHKTISDARIKHYQRVCFEASRDSSNRKTLSVYDLEEFSGQIMFVDSFEWPIGQCKYFIIADGQTKTGNRNWQAVKLCRIHVLHFYVEHIDITVRVGEKPVFIPDELDDIDFTEQTIFNVDSYFADVTQIQKFLFVGGNKNEDVGRIYYLECLREFCNFVINKVPPDLLENSYVTYLDNLFNNNQTI